LELSGPSSIGACLGHVQRVLEVLRLRLVLEKGLIGLGERHWYEFRPTCLGLALMCTVFHDGTQEASDWSRKAAHEERDAYDLEIVRQVVRFRANHWAKTHGE
jgi:hypothetical protein